MSKRIINSVYHQTGLRSFCFFDGMEFELRALFLLGSHSHSPGPESYQSSYLSKPPTLSEFLSFVKTENNNAYLEDYCED
jgi:hypothetical protein